MNTLAEVEAIALVGLGGMLWRSEMSLIGHITEQALAEVRADKVFLGIHSLDATHGLTNAYLAETMTDRAILRIGQKVVVVADHTKCERVSTAFVAPPSAVHTLVTDTAAAPTFVEALRGQGVEVLLV
jgi:DeoR/GlpR family transcriptional regulator of sugar metabolism